jgi:hypothetical protein
VIYANGEVRWDRMPAMTDPDRTWRGVIASLHTIRVLAFLGNGPTHHSRRQ